MAVTQLMVVSNILRGYYVPFDASDQNLAAGY